MRTSIKWAARTALQVLTVALAVSSVSYAGDAGHGADGVMVNGKLYLRDLVEAGNGLYLNPYFDPNVKVDPKLQAQVDDILHSIVKYGAPTRLVAQKLAEINSVNRLLALSLLRGMKLYTWSMNDQPGVEHPENGAIIKNRYIQLATRSNNHIYIFQDKWNLLDAKDRAAMIIHEIVFAFVAPIWAKGPNGEDEFIQDAKVARDVTAFLFSEDLKRKGLDGVEDQLTSSQDTFWWLEDQKGVKFEDGYMVSFDGIWVCYADSNCKEVYSYQNPDTQPDPAVVQKYCETAVKNNYEVELNVWDNFMNVWRSFGKTDEPSSTVYLTGNWKDTGYQHGSAFYKGYKNRFTDEAACITEMNQDLINAMTEINGYDNEWGVE